MDFVGGGGWGRGCEEGGEGARDFLEGVLDGTGGGLV